MNVLKKMKGFSSTIVLLFFVIVLAAGSGWAQDHDLVITPAPDITSATPSDWKSPDVKIGADFGDTSVPDVVQRGTSNRLYAKFYINGVEDATIPSGDIQVKFYWRSANIGDIPPAIDHPSWNYIDRLLVTYITADGPFVFREWPTDFPSVTTKYVTWDAPPPPPVSGTYFQVAAELVYPGLPGGPVDENPGDNVAVSLYESQAGLLDVVLLHDVSGSMATFGYMPAAISKASLFVASMNDNHRISVVSFSSRFSGGYEDVWPTTPPMLREVTDPNKIAATTAIAGLSASGGTPLGQGLERAIQILTTPLDPDRKRVIIILSDGYENTGTPRACTYTDPTNPCASSTLISQLQANSIKVFTIALGSSAWTECLECLATESGGQWYSSPSANLTLAEVYLHIQQAASLDDLYRMDHGVSGGGEDTYDIYFEGEDDVLYFMLSWDDLNANLELELTPPGRTRLNTRVFKGKGYQVIKVNRPQKGAWRYTVKGDEGKNYLAAVRSDRVGVRLRMAADTVGIVGSAVKIKAHLALGKEPITNARLTAAVQVPVGASLETMLQKASRKHLLEYKTPPVDPRILKENPDLSPRAVFIKNIMGNRQESLVKTRTVTVPLQHAGKGVYTGVLPQEYTSIAGEYSVTVTTSDRRFQRNFSRQVRLRPAEVDYKKSFAEVVTIKSPASDKPLWLLNLYAVDRFGNAITDPALVKGIKAEVKGATVSTPERTLGTFQQKLFIYAQEKPELERITLEGKQVKIKKDDGIN